MDNDNINLKSIEVKDYKAINDLVWNNIPQFAVITGKNGTGKSQLLEYINSKNLSKLQKENIMYVGSDFSFSNKTTSHNQQQHPAQDEYNIKNQLTQEKGILKTYLNMINEIKVISLESNSQFDITEYLGAKQNYTIYCDNNEKFSLSNFGAYNFINTIELKQKFINSNTCIITNNNEFKINVSIIKNQFKYNKDTIAININKLGKVSRKIEKNIDSLTIEDIDNYITINDDFIDYDSIKKFLYTYYILKKERMAVIGSNETLSENEIGKKIVEIRDEKSPIQIINELFEKYEFKYKIKELQEINSINNINLQFICKDITSPINYNSLSSGEKMVVAIVMWIHQNNYKTKLWLLDEIDSHLHPSLSKMLIDILKETVVEEYGIQVIMTTHKSSTIAYCDGDDIFVMQKELPKIQKQSKNEAINILSDGLFVINEENQQKIEILNLNRIKDINKPILLVEGITDKIILETAWRKLYDSEEIPFFIVDCFDCYFIANMFKRADIFNNYNNKTFIGLLDFDSAYKNFKEKYKEKYEKKEYYYKHKSENGYVLPLTIPKTREKYAGEDIHNSYLSIELFFDDVLIEDYCKKEKCAGGFEMLKFDDKNKMKFAENVIPTLGKENFYYFTELFEKLKTITSNESA